MENQEEGQRFEEVIDRVPFAPEIHPLLYQDRHVDDAVDNPPRWNEDLQAVGGEQHIERRRADRIEVPPVVCAALSGLVMISMVLVAVYIFYRGLFETELQYAENVSGARHGIEPRNVRADYPRLLMLEILLGIVCWLLSA